MEFCVQFDPGAEEARHAYTNCHGSLGGQPSSFDAADAAPAEERFRQLTKRGFKAIALGENGAPNKLINKFDPQVERTLFIPQLQGG